MDKRAPDKKSRLLQSLEKGMTMIHLDARRPGVIVPAALKNEPHLLLNLSYRFDPPDLAVGEWGVRSTLTFSGSRFTVAVPWSALYAISSHLSKEFWMYPDDMPRELLEGPAGRGAARGVPNPTEALPGEAGQPGGGDDSTDGPRAVLREVLKEQPGGDDAQGQPAQPAQAPRRGHLRLVK